MVLQFIPNRPRATRPQAPAAALPASLAAQIARLLNDPAACHVLQDLICCVLDENPDSSLAARTAIGGGVPR